jgi:hypothetical protein
MDTLLYIILFAAGCLTGFGWGVAFVNKRMKKRVQVAEDVAKIALGTLVVTPGVQAGGQLGNSGLESPENRQAGKPALHGQGRTQHL